MSKKVPFLNPDPLTWWNGPKNIARVKIDGESSWALLDSGSPINAVTPMVHWGSFFGHWSLEWPGQWYPGYQWFQRSILLALGLCHHKSSSRRSYNEDEVALVVPDSHHFGSWVPVTLGIPTINQIISVIKESEIDEMLVSLNGLRMAWLLACQWAEFSIKGETTMHQTVYLTDLKEAVKTTKKEERCFFIQNCTWLNENHAPWKTARM